MDSDSQGIHTADALRKFLCCRLEGMHAFSFSFGVSRVDSDLETPSKVDTVRSPIFESELLDHL